MNDKGVPSLRQQVSAVGAGERFDGKWLVDTRLQPVEIIQEFEFMREGVQSVTDVRSFFGKYRGEVVDDRDPDKLGRVKVKVPAFPDLTSWAMPCVPYAGKGVGWFVVPPVGASVWVEFEGGHPDYPIWTGCFWDTKEDLPGKDGEGQGDPDYRVWHTPGAEVTLSHLKDKEKLEIKVSKPLSDKVLTLTMDKDGITLDDGGKCKINLTDEVITVDDQGKSRATFTDQTITVENSAVKFVVDGGGTKASLTDGTGKLEIASGTVTASTGSSKQVLDATGVTIQRGGVKIQLTDSGIESAAGSTKIIQQVASLALQNGAAEVALSPASVNINKGALEVI